MSPERVIARAEVFKRKHHRLSLAFRLKSLGEARKFIREHSAVLWNGKAEIPNMLDAILGRIANGQERLHSKAADNCLQWRKQLLTDPEFLECCFFQKLPTVVHNDLWPYLTVFARANREKTSDESVLSREARKLLLLLEKSGPAPAGHLRKMLRLTTPQERRAFQRIKKELQSQLLVIVREQPSEDSEPAEALDLWENRMPRNVLTRAEHIDPQEARSGLLQAALNGCVLAPEKNVRRWFAWHSDDTKQALDQVISSKQFLRLEHRNGPWIVSKKALNGH